MDPARYARLQEIFTAAAPLSPEAREAFVVQACDGDGALADEARALLAHAATERDADQPLSEGQLDAMRGRLEEALDGNGTAAPGPLVGSGRGGMPETVGRYRIVRRLGAGGMGVVYEAAQESPRRRVALKVIPPHRATPERLRRFRQEAEVLGRLQHPGIAQIYEAGTFDLGEGAQPFFAMEFIDGVDVRTHAERAHLDTRGRLALVAEIAGAMHYAHEQGVIHRDLKPENVFIDAHGGVKVLDFGVARASETSTAISTIVTHEGQIIGTLAYMAPEQLSADPEKVTPRADVYALGVLAFELLAGRLPHDLEGLPTTAAIHALTEADAPRLGRLRPGLRGDVETIVGKALEKEPERRYASAAALAADVRRHLDDLPITARPPGRLYRARKFTRRNRALVAGAAATMITLAAGMAVAIVLANREREQRGLADARAVEARRNETQAVGALLQSTQSLLDGGQIWGAKLQHDTVPPHARDWTWELVGRGVPIEIEAEHAASHRADSGWQFIDRDHLWRLNVGRSAIEVYSVPERRIVRTLFRGLGLVQHSRDQAVEGGRMAMASEDEGFLLDLDRGTVIDRWPVMEPWASKLSRYGRLDVRRQLPGPHFWEVRRDGILLRGLARSGADAPFGVFPYPSGDLLAVAYEDRLDFQDVASGEVRYRLDENVRNGILLFDGGFFRFGTPPARRWIERFELTGNGIVGGGIELGPKIGTVTNNTPDGRLLCLGGCKILDAVTGEPYLASHFQTEDGFIAQEGQAMSGRFAPDGTRICIQSVTYRKPWIVDLDPREREPGFDPRCLTLQGHTEWIYHVAVSNDGRLIASAAPRDPFVRIWETDTGKAVGRLERRTATPQSWDALLAFTPDDEQLVMTTPYGEDAMAVVAWDLVRGGVAVTPVDPGRVTGQRHTMLLDDFIERVRPAPGARLSQRAQMRPDVGSASDANDASDETGAIAVSVDAQINATPHPADAPRSGRRWRPAPGLPADDDKARGLSVDPRGDRFAVVSRVRLADHLSQYTRRDVGSLRILDVEIGEERRRIELEHVPWACAYSPDGRLLAVGMHDGFVVIFETEFFTRRLSLRAHDDYVYSLAWTPDGTRLVTASGDKKVKIWDGRSTSASFAERKSWRERRASFAERSDLAEVYPSLTGDDRSAARIELMRRTAAPRSARVAERHDFPER